MQTSEHTFSFSGRIKVGDNDDDDDDDVMMLTLFLIRMAEHCRGAPISLWGFHVTDEALWRTVGHRPS
jgi:hypothetical protein